jgi:glycosyltransferase involved in cell wall biosynthesis
VSSRARRITFVHDFFPPGDAPIGGSGKVLQIIALECQKRGFEPTIFVDAYYKTAPHLSRWERDGIPVHQFPLLRCIPTSARLFGKTRRRQWWAKWKLSNILQAAQPAIVHTHVDFPNGLLRLGLEFKRRLGSKLVVTSHGLEGFEQMGARYTDSKLEPDWIEAVEAVDVWVPCGPADHTELVRWGIPETKIKPINNGIPVPDSLPPRAMRDLDGTVKIAFIGNITGTKGVFDLAKAMIEFVKLAPGLRPSLHYVGLASAEVERIIREALDPHRDKLDYSFPGHVTIERIREIHQTTDIFCYPSRRREGIPMAILEAAAHGCPMVVSDAPGHMAVVKPDVHAAVHKQGDVAGLASALVRLAKDPTLRASMRQNAYEHVKAHFNREQMVHDYMSLFESLLEGRA